MSAVAFEKQQQQVVVQQQQQQIQQNGAVPNSHTNAPNDGSSAKNGGSRSASQSVDETPVVAPSKEEKKKNAAQKEKKSRRKIKIKLSLPGKEKDVKKHLEFIFTLDKDTPDGLANEIFHAREDLGISLVEEQIVKVANTIRKSVNLVKLKVKKPRSAKGSKADSVIVSSKTLKPGDTSLLASSGAPAILEQDKEYQKEYEKYNSELQKLYTEQKVRKQKKDNDLLKKIETETIEVTEFMKSARINVDNWNKTYEKGLADKVAVTTKIMDDAQRSTQ